MTGITGRERIRKALRRQEVDRAPWVPFVGCHAASLLGVSAEDYLKSEDLIVAGVQEGIKRYAPDGVPVIFDLQVEAEALGCELKWAKDNPPAVVSHPLKLDDAALARLAVPGPSDGRIAAAFSAARRLRQANPDVALYGLITGPFTLALHLLGADIFMAMFEQADKVQRLMAFASRVGQTMARGYIEAGCDIVAVVDPMTSQIGPDQFVEFVTPHATPIFASIRKAGALGSFFVCGHAQQNLEVMCDCHPDSLSVDENIPLATVRDLCLERGVGFGGNMQLTAVLLLGTPEDAQRHAVECLNIGGTRGFVLAPGCDLPYATPPANLEAVGEVVRDPYRRAVAAALTAPAPSTVTVELPDYAHLPHVLLDIITLDSASCAPCQYMIEAVRGVAAEFNGGVEWQEHKIKQRESLAVMQALGVKNVPTICIDGQIAFVSRIPPRDELAAAVRQRVEAKQTKS